MLIRLEQLSQQLNKGLAPVYLLSSDEPLLLQEARDFILQRAHLSGFKERQLLQADSNFDWSFLIMEMQTNSLFSEQRILDLRFSQAPKLSTAAQKLLLAYAEQPNPDCCCIISLPKVDSLAKHALYKALTDKTIAITIWPLDRNQYAQWLREKLKKFELTMSPAALQVLIEFCENNLLAALQTLQKLKLLTDPATLIEVEQLHEALVDQAHFSIFDLSESVLQGDGKRIIRILREFKESGTDPHLVLWVLAREIRLLARLAASNNLTAFWEKERISEKRRCLYHRYLQQHIAKLTQTNFFVYLNQIDCILKGHTLGLIWDELMQCALNLAGYPLLPQRDAYGHS